MRLEKPVSNWRIRAGLLGAALSVLVTTGLAVRALDRASELRAGFLRTGTALETLDRMRAGAGGDSISDALRVMSAALREQEVRLLEDRERVRRARVLVAGSALLALALLLLAARAVRRERSEARRRLRELEASESLLRTTIDSLEQRIAVLDEAGSVLAANEAGRRFLEEHGARDVAEVASVYLPPRDAPDGDDARPARAAWEGLHAVLTGRRREFQLEYPCGEGEDARWSLLRVIRSEAESGDGAVRVVVAHEDITDRVRTARALRKGEAHFRSMVSSMDDLVFALDRELRHIGIYGRWIERAGLNAREFVGRRPTEVLESSAARALEAAGRRALQGEHVVYQWTLPNDEGGRHIETAVSPLRDDDGAITGAVGVGRDITRRVRAEEATRRRDAILHAIGSASQRFLRGGDLERTIDDALAELGRASGASRVYLLEMDPLTGAASDRGLRHVWRAPDAPDSLSDPFAVVPPLDRLDDWTARLSAGETVEGRRGDASDALRDYLDAYGIRSTILVPVFAGKQWVGCLGIDACQAERSWSTAETEALRTAADIIGAAMDRKQIEDALREREEQLRQSQKMEAIGRLAGGIAHDFNNLLTAIQGRTVLLLSESTTDGALREDLVEIRDAAERAATLTRQLLAFSRRQVLEPKALDLNHVIRDVEVMLRRLIGEDVLLITRLSNDLGTVLVDPNNIVQVLMNLAVNARDAMPEGGMIVVSTANVDVGEPRGRAGEMILPGAYVALEFSDTGSGIPEEILERIFEPFFTTKGPGKGTGLGLSMVYGIVRQSGGHVEVESEVGRGTTFRVLLPRHSAAAEPEPPATPAPAAPENGHETVLLAEDEAAVRSLVRRVLERHGYTVLEASNGAEAIQIALGFSGRIDLLLTDVVMPDLGGPELAERIAATHPELPVMFMSGYADREIVRRGARGLHAAFLAKPFSPDRLTRRVREVLDTHLAAS